MSTTACYSLCAFLHRFEPASDCCGKDAAQKGFGVEGSIRFPLILANLERVL